MKKQKIKIEDEKFYSLGEIVKQKLIRGVNTIPKASRLVNSAITREILRPKVIKRGVRGMQYKILGIHIKEYLQHEKESNNT